MNERPTYKKNARIIATTKKINQSQARKQNREKGATYFQKKNNTK